MKLLWLDIETAGLRPNEDAILEISAAVAPFRRPFDLGPRHTWVFSVDSETYFKADDKVRAMHTQNGLWEACRTSTTRLSEAESALLDLAEPERSDLFHMFGGTEEEPPEPDKLCDLCLMRFEDFAQGDGDACPEAARKNKTILAGTSVHFDLGFLRVQMPTLAKKLSHRVYDVSAFALFCQSMGMETVKSELIHRASDDIDASVRYAQRCVQWLGQSSLFPKRSP